MNGATSENVTRGGRSKHRDEPERRCIVSGEVAPKRGLLRFVVSPDGVVVPDLLERLPGRGMWVSADREALATAGRRRLFDRAARRGVTVPEDLARQVEDGLARRVVEGISLARKAGQAVAGYEKVKAWLAKEEARVLIQARDGSERGRSKLSTPHGGRFVGVLNAGELGLAFGRERVIHAALAAGGLTDRIVKDAARLSGVREVGGGGATGKDE